MSLTDSSSSLSLSLSLIVKVNFQAPEFRLLHFPLSLSLRRRRGLLNQELTLSLGGRRLIASPGLRVSCSGDDVTMDS